ncbi:MAG: hypothetical protein JKY32_02835, partial [Rhizobiales bacterium]|nr:hypothetical protein [Hyphomicrobiales bacterium]
MNTNTLKSETGAAPARSGSRLWLWLVGAIVLIAIVPIIAILVIALKAENNIWPHLVSTVLPRAAFD